MTGAIWPGVSAVLALSLAWTVWGNQAARGRLRETADHYRRLLDGLRYPPIPAELRDELNELAQETAAIDMLTPGLLFRGQLLADRLRKRVGGADLNLAHVLQVVITTADKIEPWALTHELDPFTTTRYVLAAAATELSRWERIIPVEYIEAPDPEAAQ